MVSPIMAAEPNMATKIARPSAPPHDILQDNAASNINKPIAPNTTSMVPVILHPLPALFLSSDRSLLNNFQNSFLVNSFLPVSFICFSTTPDAWL